MSSKAIYSAFDTALYYITFKDRTIKEIQGKLKDKGYSDSEIDDATSKLIEYGYINEDNYAFSYIKSNINNKGIKRIKQELLSKGLDKTTIIEQSSMFDICEDDIIINILEKRYPHLDYSKEKEMRKVYSFFVRRGFRYDSISSALSKYRKNSIIALDL
ncbi:MAG: regulatory protein RecX [Lachnospiraceae bacterium]|nr:regulatory protein RecX [Lachnospiraceae bacterium]